MSEVKKEVQRPSESMGFHSFNRIGRDAVVFDQRAKYSFDPEVLKSLKEKELERQSMLREVVGDDADEEIIIPLDEVADVENQ